MEYCLSGLGRGGKQSRDEWHTIQQVFKDNIVRICSKTYVHPLLKSEGIFCR